MVKSTEIKKNSKGKPLETFVSKAILSNIRVTPRKARLVIDMVRGRKVDVALDILSCNDKKTSPMLTKLLMSAVSNAADQSRVNVDSLFVKRAWVDEGTKYKRSMPRAQGRATPIIKRNSTITILLDTKRS